MRGESGQPDAWGGTRWGGREGEAEFEWRECGQRKGAKLREGEGGILV